MKNKRYLRGSLATGMASLLCCMPLLGHAASDRYQFSGFASFGIGKSLERDELYGESSSKVPYSTEYRDFSKLGLRMTADLDDNLTMTAQMVALGQDDFDPEFDWIFASYNISPNLVVHVGKYVTSYYMYSDYVDISYAYQWVQAPDVVYNRGANKTLNGAKLVWNTRMGSWTSELSLLTGEDESSIADAGIDTTLNIEDAAGFSWQLDRDWLTLRTSYLRSKTTADLSDSDLDVDNLLLGIATQITPVIDTQIDPSASAELNAALASSLSADFRDSLYWDDDTSEFFGFGTSMHFGSVFMTAEITHVDVGDTITVGTQDAGYLMIGGYLPGRVSVAATFYDKRNQTDKDQLDAYEDFAKAATSASANPAVAGAALAVYGEAIEQTLDTIQKQRRQGISLSTRWDFHSNAAFKVEYLTEIQKQGNADKTTPQALLVGIDLVF